ncbi:MAG TPA: hypothetical protein PLK12_11030 [Prolixibacteraceae bacterium]|nr:hypothetical protein [Prolixibacteraceae bacterium]
MKKILFFLSGALLYLLVQGLFGNYGNRVVHPNFNTLMVEKFNLRFLNALTQPDNLKNVTIVFNGSSTLKGSRIYSGGFLRQQIIENESGLNALQWIAHGGFSADEPEIFASFRHFYDPTEPEGSRYLKNHLDALMGKENPKIDILTWSLNHPEHQYNWENAKTAVIMALSNPDEDSKNSEMAFAYRALGETLHMIADMGCPAHVRDDSHAAVSVKGYNFGSPDPYEENFEVFSDIKTHFSNGKVDSELKSYFKSAKSVKDIAIRLAQYTNQNFFTDQTISGINVVPAIHPEKTYPSPKLEQCTYDPLDFTYRKTISENEVIMCKDLRYKIFGTFQYRGYPYIDKECVETQGRALSPQIIEAGANVIRLFYPELKVEIEKYDGINQTIKGKVTHKPNSEYSREIKYNGKVVIYNAKNLNKIAEVDCEDGVYDAKINANDFRKVDWKTYGIYAQIGYGGVYVKSDKYLDSGNDLPTGIHFSAEVYGTIRLFDQSNNSTSEWETTSSIINNKLTHISKEGTYIIARGDSTFGVNGSANYRQSTLVRILLDKKNVVEFEAYDTVWHYNIPYPDVYIRYCKSVENPFQGVNWEDFDSYGFTNKPGSSISSNQNNTIETFNEVRIVTNYPITETFIDTDHPESRYIGLVFLK